MLFCNNCQFVFKTEVNNCLFCEQPLNVVEISSDYYYYIALPSINGDVVVGLLKQPVPNCPMIDNIKIAYEDYKIEELRENIKNLRLWGLQWKKISSYLMKWSMSYSEKF